MSLAFIVGLALTTLPALASSNNTPTIGNGDCWRGGTPFTCRVTWTGVNTFIYFRAIDQYSAAEPGWTSPVTAAVAAWNSAPGPQFYSFTPHSNDTWIYIVAAQTGQHGLTSSMVGLTWNCDRSGYCTDLNQAMDIYWSNVYLNQSTLNGQAAAYVQNTAAHESGHAMGLYHNSSDSSSVMWPYETTVPGPDANDIGTYPGCSSSGAGIDCIYGFGDG